MDSFPSRSGDRPYGQLHDFYFLVKFQETVSGHADMLDMKGTSTQSLLHGVCDIRFGDHQIA
eukprot:scaffold356081_cov36-Prasinocladus_malaysianus.AAC.2